MVHRKGRKRPKLVQKAAKTNSTRWRISGKTVSVGIGSCSTTGAVKNTLRAIEMRRENGPHGDRTRPPCLRGTALHQKGGRAEGGLGWVGEGEGARRHSRAAPANDGCRGPPDSAAAGQSLVGLPAKPMRLLPSVVQTSEGISPSKSGVYPRQISPGRCFPSVITNGRFP